jgi:hypothetical protein
MEIEFADLLNRLGVIAVGAGQSANNFCAAGISDCPVQSRHQVSDLLGVGLQFRQKTCPFQIAEPGQLAGNRHNGGIGFQVKVKQFVVSVSEFGSPAQQVADGDNANQRTIDDRLV